MKHHFAIRAALWGALIAALPAAAQSSALDRAVAVKGSEERPRNRLGLGYRMGFNMPVSFKNLGGYPALSTGQVTPDGAPFNYDNGYVLEDSSHNAGGSTWNWGYNDASQVLGNQLLMQRSSSPATGYSNDHYDTPTSGLELTYNRELITKKSWRGGLEGAFGYNHLHVRDAGTQSATVNRVTDSYTFQGVPGAQPPPGYRGTFNGPGEFLSASPSSSASDTSQAGSITGSHDFSANLYNFRFGPYVEFPLTERIAFGLSGGFALMFVTSEFSYSETVTIPGVGSVDHDASGSASDWLPGGYVAGHFSVALSEAWSVMAGAQFQDVGRYTQTLNGKQATLDLRRAIFVTIGVSYSF